MGFEETIATIINEYGSQLWLAFITMVATGFALVLVKNLISDLAYYFRARTSDVGFGQRIYYGGCIYLVRSIHFKYILIYDDKKIIRIPLNKYMDGAIEFPQPRYDDFDEEKYHEPKWDGKRERRGSRVPGETRPAPKPANPPSTPKSSDIAHQVSSELTDRMIWLMLGEERYNEIFQNSKANWSEEESEILSRLSEEDFSIMNNGMAALMKVDDSFSMNEKGLPLTREELRIAKRAVDKHRKRPTDD